MDRFFCGLWSTGFVFCCSFFRFCAVSCARLSWHLVNFWAHVQTYTVSYRTTIVGLIRFFLNFTVCDANHRHWSTSYRGLQFSEHIVMETNVQRNRNTNYLSFVALSQFHNERSERRERGGRGGGGGKERPTRSYIVTRLHFYRRPMYLNEMAYNSFLSLSAQCMLYFCPQVGFPEFVSLVNLQ